MDSSGNKYYGFSVAPLVGAWIEIVKSCILRSKCWSLPLWERGLKSCQSPLHLPPASVAPLVGAWIEIKINEFNEDEVNVAPLVGAWIEILLIPRFDLHPSRRSPCGSVDWNDRSCINSAKFLVAPLVGAWIEISVQFCPWRFSIVAPLVGAWIEILKSAALLLNTNVAPLVGAWIEMIKVKARSKPEMSLPLWERGLKLLNTQDSMEIPCRSPCGSVDWNQCTSLISYWLVCRSPCGSVDWNLFLPCHCLPDVVAPLVGAWIEIPISTRENQQITSLPLWERGLKFLYSSQFAHGVQSLPLWERGLKSVYWLRRSADRRRSPCGSVDWNPVSVI